jgi:pimeloyl-ACP methyl ester carboxylesterase
LRGRGYSGHHGRPERPVLNPAIDHAAEFRALIGLEGADFQAPWYDTSWLNRPDVRSGEVCAALVLRPDRPAKSGKFPDRDAMGLLRGRVEKIDTKVCPLFLPTGAYDFSCTPENTKRTAAAAIMEQLGHFPISENPTQFRRHISPVLDLVVALEVECARR